MNTHELIEALRAQADFIDADTYDECWEVKETPRGKMLRAAAFRLSEMDAEIKRLEKERAYAVRWGEGAVESVKEVMWRYEDALTFTREALFSALAGSNAAGDAETVDDVLKTLQWMADHLNPAYSLCVSVFDGRPPAPHFQKNIDAKRAEYAARAALEHDKGEPKP